jgi:hypothetical protein
MHRLVIALTTLLTLAGATVVAGYLLVFGAATDRAATVVPADAPLYLNVYLKPSTAQQMKLAGLLGRLPGFGDEATLDTKIDEALQQALGQLQLDYRHDLKPWLGDQLAIASWPDLNGGTAPTLVVAAVKDRAAAEAALQRRAEASGSSVERSDHAGTSVVQAGAVAYAFVAEGLLALGTQRAVVERSIDVAAGNAGSLAAEAAFRQAGDRLPADYLASAYLDLNGLAADAGAGQKLAGFSWASIALLATDAGLELTGQAPVTAQLAESSTRSSLALSNEPPSLTDWMPEATSAEAVVFGLRGALETIEAEVQSSSGAADVAQALTQLRAVVAFGLGLSVDDDLLPLLDREAAVALTGQGSQPQGVLLLRPSDGAAATAALDRIRGALEQRGATSSTGEGLGGTTITTVELPDTGSAAYAVSNGVVILALRAEDVRAALQAHAERKTLAGERDYRDAFAAIGVHGGNELYADVGSLLSALGSADALSSETRDILQHVGAVGVTIPAREDRIEFHAIVTVR